MMFKFIGRVSPRLDIKPIQYAGIQPILMLITSIFIHRPYLCSSHALCPPNYVYLESGNDCVFILNTCGNSSYGRHKCEYNLGTLISLIYKENHFNDVCEFAKKRLPDNSSFHLGAHRIKDKFVWDFSNTEVSFPETLMFIDEGDHDCLEINLSNGKCNIKSAPCHKHTFTVCEFSHVNPCVYNNGDCEGVCVPRHRGERICLCPSGFIVEGTRCVTTKFNIKCPFPSIYHSKGDVCLYGNKQTSLNSEGMLICLTSVTLTDGLFNAFKYETIVERYCTALRRDNPNNEMLYHTAGFYHKTNPGIVFANGFSFQPKMCKKLYTNMNDYSYPVVLRVNKTTCCFDVVPPDFKTQSICGIELPNECTNPPDFGNCPQGTECVPKSGYKKYECKCQPGYQLYDGECVDVDECPFQNGGCFHICQNTVGSRECLCWEGYNLFNKTECGYKDRCKSVDGGGENGCPEPPKIDMDGIGCQFGVNDNDNVLSISTESGNRLVKQTNFIVIIIIIILFSIMFLVSLPKWWSPRQQQNT